MSESHREETQSTYLRIDARDEQIDGFMRQRRASLGLESPAAIRGRGFGEMDASGALAQALAASASTRDVLYTYSQTSAYYLLQDAQAQYRRKQRRASLSDMQAKLQLPIAEASAASTADSTASHSDGRGSGESRRTPSALRPSTGQGGRSGTPIEAPSTSLDRHMSSLGKKYGPQSIKDVLKVRNRADRRRRRRSSTASLSDQLYAATKLLEDDDGLQHAAVTALTRVEVARQISMQKNAQHKPSSSSSSSSSPRRRTSKASSVSHHSNDGGLDGQDDDPLLDEDVGPPHLYPAEQRLVAAWLLKKHPVLFGDLPMASMLGLARRLKIYRPAVGQLVTLQGDIGRAFYLIVRGKAEVRLVSSQRSGRGSGGRGSGGGTSREAAVTHVPMSKGKQASPKSKRKKGALAGLVHKSATEAAADASYLSVDPAALATHGRQGESMGRLNAAVVGAGMSLSWDTGERQGGGADRQTLLSGLQSQVGAPDALMSGGGGAGDVRRGGRGRPGQRRRADYLLDNGLTVEDEMLLGDDESDDETAGGQDWHDDEASGAARDKKKADAVLKRAQSLLPQGVVTPGTSKTGVSVRFEGYGDGSTGGGMPSAIAQQLAEGIPKDRSGSGQPWMDDCSNAPVFAYGFKSTASKSGHIKVPPGFMEAQSTHYTGSVVQHLLQQPKPGKRPLTPHLLPIDEFGESVATLRAGETFGDLALLASPYSSSWHNRRQATVLITESGEEDHALMETEEDDGTPKHHSSTSWDDDGLESSGRTAMSKDLQRYSAMLRKMRMAGAAKAMKAVATVMQFAKAMSGGAQAFSGEGIARLLNQYGQRKTIVAKASRALLVAIDRDTFVATLRRQKRREVRERLSFLRRLGPFLQWPSRKLIPLAYALKECSYATKENVWNRGDKADGLLMIRSGSVHVSNHVTVGSHGPLALTPHRRMETDATKKERKRKSKKHKTEITTVFEYETRTNIIYASTRMPTLAQSMRLPSAAGRTGVGTTGYISLGGYGHGHRRTVLRSDGGPSHAMPAGVKVPRSVIGHSARPSDQTMLLMHRLASQRPTKYLDIKRSEASLACESSIIGAEDVLLPMLEVCGAVVRAPAAVKRLIVAPQDINPAASMAGGDATSSSRPAQPTRSRRGSITLSTGYYLLQHKRPIRATSVEAASNVKAYFLSADDVAKMLLNDIYGATVRFGGVPGMGGRLQMPGASTIGVVIDAGALLEKYIDADSLLVLDSTSKRAARGTHTADDTGSGGVQDPNAAAGVGDGAGAVHSSGTDTGEVVSTHHTQIGIHRPPERGVVPMHEIIVLAPAARQAARSCSLCGLACAGLIAGSLARSLLALARASPRHAGRPSAAATDHNQVTRAVKARREASDMGMKSMSLASKQQADMTSRKIKALARLDPRLTDAIRGSMPKAAIASGLAESKGSIAGFIRSADAGTGPSTIESQASLAALAASRHEKRSAERRAVERLNTSAGNAAAFILCSAGEHRPSPMELGSVAAHEQASKAVRASSNVAKRRLRMHIAAAIGMHLKDGVTDWNAAGIPAIGPSTSPSPSQERKRGVAPLDLGKLRYGTSMVLPDGPPGETAVVAEVSLRSLDSQAGEGQFAPSPIQSRRKLASPAYQPPSPTQRDYKSQQLAIGANPMGTGSYTSRYPAKRAGTEHGARDSMPLSARASSTGHSLGGSSLWPSPRGGTLSQVIPPRTAAAQLRRSRIPQWAKGYTVGEGISRKFQSKMRPRPPTERMSQSARRPQSLRYVAALSDYDSEVARELRFRSVMSNVGSTMSAGVGWYPGRHTRQRSRDRTAVDLARKQSRHLQGNAYNSSMASIVEQESMLTLETGPPVHAPTLAALRTMARESLVEKQSGGGSQLGAGMAVDSMGADTAAAMLGGTLSNPTLVSGRIGDENEASLLVAGRVPAASSTPDGWWSRVQQEMDRRQDVAVRARSSQRKAEAELRSKHGAAVETKVDIVGPITSHLRSMRASARVDADAIGYRLGMRRMKGGQEQLLAGAANASSGGTLERKKRSGISLLRPEEMRYVVSGQRAPLQGSFGRRQ